MKQHLAQKRKSAGSDDTVCLLVIARDDVANGAQGWGLDDFFTGGDELYEVPGCAISKREVRF
jgi:hypothetical protein